MIIIRMQGTSTQLLWKRRHAMKTETRRKHPRGPCYLEASCQIGDTVLIGKVCDVSPGGMFFAPEYAGGVDGLSGDVCASNYVEIGDLVTFTVDGFAREIKAEICWIGESERHARHGFGVRYVRATTNYGINRLHELREKLAELNAVLMLATAGGMVVSDRELMHNAQHRLANGLQCCYAVEAKLKESEDRCICKVCRKSHLRRDCIRLGSGVLVCEDCSANFVAQGTVFDNMRAG